MQIQTKFIHKDGSNLLYEVYFYNAFDEQLDDDKNIITAVHLWLDDEAQNGDIILPLNTDKAKENIKKELKLDEFWGFL